MRMHLHRLNVSWGAKLLCLAMGGCALLASAQIEDRRSAIAKESAAYWAQHPEALQFLERFTRSRAGRHHHGRLPTEVPGGVGYGYFFWNNTLLWTNSSILDYYIVTPDRAGGNLQTWQYLTSTCRSPLGTESLVSYFADEAATFM